MDAFYASVEQRDFPEYRNIPIAVGGSPQRRGVVTTASYEARKYGVRSAMSSHKALQLCPHIKFVSPRFDVYREVSQQIRAIFRRYTDVIEPLSLDEAYLDVTRDKMNIGSAIDVANEIKQAIYTELGLTASAGVSINKFVAKIASDINKPNGLTFIGPSRVIQFMEDLPVDKFFGVGKVTAQKMHKYGIFTGKDLKQLSMAEMISRFGKSGAFFYNIVRGKDDRPVRPIRIPKSIGAEDTFEMDLEDISLMKEELKILCEKVEKRLKSKAQKGRTVTLKIKFSNFRTITRSITHQNYVDSSNDLFKIVCLLLDNEGELQSKVRLLGVTVSNFLNNDFQKQLSLF